MIDDDGVGAPTLAHHLTEDEKRLHELGYAQELRRHMSGFTNFAVSFTIISILSGCLTLYGFGMNTGGPVLITWGWPVVGLMTLFVGLADGRGLLRVPDGRGPLLLVGQAGAAQPGRVVVVHRMVQLPRPGRGDRRHRLRRGVLPQRPARRAMGTSHTRPWHTIVLFAAILVLHGLLNPSASPSCRAPEQRAASGGTSSGCWSSSACWRSRRRTTSRRRSCSRTSSTTRAGARRSTCCCSACCWRSTRSPGTTRRRT